MGIGNTTPAAALIAAGLGVPASEVTGRGTGIDDPALAHKQQLIETALRRAGDRVGRPGRRAHRAGQRGHRRRGRIPARRRAGRGAGAARRHRVGGRGAGRRPDQPRCGGLVRGRSSLHRAGAVAGAGQARAWSRCWISGCDSARAAARWPPSRWSGRRRCCSARWRCCPTWLRDGLAPRPDVVDLCKLTADGLRLAVGTFTAIPVPAPRRITRPTARAAMILAPLATLPIGGGRGRRRRARRLGRAAGPGHRRRC